MSVSGPLPRYGAVVLTQGKRPAELRAALDSILRQRDVDLDVVVVGNGWHPAGLPAGVNAVSLPNNLGIPAGRNAGPRVVAGDLLLFLDDDAALATDDALARLAARLRADRTLGLLQPRVVDPASGATLRRWVPRLRVGDPARSSDVCAVWEGAVVVRRDTFDAAGGWPSRFHYGHEGIELAWRVWNTGRRVRYVGDVVVHHPVVDPRRHAGALRLSARNRVWLARRNLPSPLGAVYAGVWFLLTGVRTRRATEIGELLRGYRDGWQLPAGTRRPVSWAAVWRMTRAGRPPVV